MTTITEGILITLLVTGTLAGIVGLVLGAMLTPTVLWRLWRGYRLPKTEQFLVLLWSFFVTGIWFLVYKTGPATPNDGLIPSKYFAIVSLILLAVGSIGMLPVWWVYRQEGKTAKVTRRR